jgi:multidrug efflux pump subunit AcrA (membrane-fusion protein)
MQQRIWVASPGGEAKPVLIKTGISDGRHTEILNGELKEDDRVIVGYRDQWKQTHESGGSGFKFGFRQ